MEAVLDTHAVSQLAADMVSVHLTLCNPCLYDGSTRHPACQISDEQDNFGDEDTGRKSTAETPRSK